MSTATTEPGSNPSTAKVSKLIQDAATFLWSPSVHLQQKIPGPHSTPGEEARRTLAHDVILRIEITTTLNHKWRS
jgi:hypothetical protein